MARTLRQSWLDEMGRAERAEAQLQQAQEEQDRHERINKGLRIANKWLADQGEGYFRVGLSMIQGLEAERDRAIERAEAAEALNVPIPDDPNPCPRCGRRSGLGASVSSEDWFRITGHWNGGGHLCLWCMDALAVEKGLSGIHCTLAFAGRAIWSDDDPVEEACQARARGRMLWKQVVEEQTILRITTGYLMAAEGLLEAAWLQSGHPHFQTWYENLSPAAKEILEKAQAHDAMERENERLRTFAKRMRDLRYKAPEQLLSDRMEMVRWVALQADRALAGKEPE